MRFQRFFASAIAALVLGGVACSSSSPTKADEASSSGGSPDPGEQTGSSSSASSSSGDLPVDAGADIGASIDPGPGPTAQCPTTPDSAGFFTMTAADTTYSARLPANYDAATPYPLVVALKGCFDNAQNFATWAGAPYTLRSAQSYIAISVGGRDGECWKIPADEALVTAAITHARSCFHVDQKKIVLSGYDSGGELAFAMSMHDANTFSGILVSKATLSQAVGKSKVDSTLAGAAWKLNVAMQAGVDDDDYPIATVRSDHDKLVAAGFPAELVETQADHNGSTDDFALLIPKMASWVAP